VTEREIPACPLCGHREAVRPLARLYDDAGLVRQSWHCDACRHWWAEEWKTR
jgi:transposase-like protein